MRPVIAPVGGVLRLALLPAFCATIGCRSHTPPSAPVATPTSSPDSGRRFAEIAPEFLRQHMSFRPQRAVELGLHEYDGRLPVYSAEAMRLEVARMRDAKAVLEGLEPAEMRRLARIERSVLLSSIRHDLFEIERLRLPWRAPRFYAEPLDLVPYLSRAYAPLATRALAVIAICDQTPDYLRQADENLAQALPKVWLELGLLQFKGLVTFAKHDVPRAFSGLDAALQKKLRSASDKLVTALTKFVDRLQARMPHATDDYALGSELFLEMLSQTEDVRVDLARLKRIGQQDLDRNLKAMQQAARRVDAKRPARAVIAEVLAEKPAMDELLKIATEQGHALRQMLLDKAIVSIPSDKRAEVRPSPPFMRWNSAFLSRAGPFETQNLPSFYYLSPPDPTWPKAEQQAYLPARVDLLFATVHELWPGHFLDALHLEQSKSAVLKTFWGYGRGEGWAHYAEELMWEQGLGDGDPKVHIGMLSNALLRNVRYMSAIGLHTEGMTVEQSMRMFEEKAYVDKATARQQARRGTFDPMYLNYTLGKLMIRKLHRDWRAKMGQRYALRAFHDAFLGCCGGAPIPVVRRVMMGDTDRAGLL